MIKQCLIWITLLLLPILSSAQSAPALYTSQVDINKQSPAAMNKAFQQGLIQVLIKVSGNESIGTLPQIRDQLNSAKSLVHSFHFTTTDDTDIQANAQSITNLDPNSNQEKQQISIQYDKTAINKLLNNTNQAIWGADRPLTLVWLDTSSKNILNAMDDDPLKTEIQTIANQRGIPLIFPLMDLQDQAYLTSKSLSRVQINALLQRYHADAILIGQMHSTTNQTKIEWHLNYQQQLTNWSNQALNPNATLVAGINQVANFYANQFAVIDTNNLLTSYTIAIDGISNLSQYGKLTAVLNNINLIDHYDIQDMNANGVVVKIDSSANLQQLSQALSSSHRLTLANIADPQNNTLTFNWHDTDTAVSNIDPVEKPSNDQHSATS